MSSFRELPVAEKTDLFKELYIYIYIHTYMYIYIYIYMKGTIYIYTIIRNPTKVGLSGYRWKLK